MADDNGRTVGGVGPVERTTYKRVRRKNRHDSQGQSWEEFFEGRGTKGRKDRGRKAGRRSSPEDSGGGTGVRVDRMA
ncbi:MAG: hypothetical protein K9L28_06750 [Synergistales bacterium]|nr:hypothetical protein [Synergistales bacterium]